MSVTVPRRGIGRRTVRWVSFVALGGLAVFAHGPPPAAGSSASLDRFTLDGGGLMRLSWRGFELSGTIGQPDACGVLADRRFTLTGGFWFGVPPGDCNDDGGVSLLDYRDFESCLAGPTGGAAGARCPCFDQDADRDVDLADFALVQSEFTTPGPPPGRP